MDLCIQELESRKNNLKKLWELKTVNDIAKVKELTRDCYKNVGAGVNCDDKCPIESLCFYHEVG